ncbi:MAG: hypothetical protein ACTSR8_09460 [Promethearchaeota archaeon]
MTAQMPDQFFYRDYKLDLVGIKGNELPVPIDFGVETMMASTACWRGYVMRYRIIENRLVLEGFCFATKMDELPEINGVKPIKLSKETAEEGDWMHTIFRNEYKNLDLTIQFTGSLWLAKDFIDSEYVHMGFQSPTAYRTVLKFDFEQGIIVNVEDKSKEAEISREKGGCKESQPKSMSSKDLDDWIMKRFSLDIDFYKKGKKDNI